MRFFLAIFLAWGVLAVPIAAEPVAPLADSAVYQFDNERSSMSIYGSSNVRDWTMDVTQINGTVLLGEGNEALPAIRNVEVEVPVKHLVSDKDRLQRHAHEALHTKEYPTISFSSSDVQVKTAQSDSFAVVAKGTLTIKGNTHAVTLTAKGARQPDGTLTVVGEHRLKMSTYDVERPSLMFGAIKATDPVRVEFDVSLTPSSTSSSAAEE